MPGSFGCTGPAFPSRCGTWGTGGVPVPTGAPPLPSPPFKSLTLVSSRYAREEFRRIWDFPRATSAQWREFVDGWRRYLSMMQGTADLPDASGSIPDDALSR